MAIQCELLEYDSQCAPGNDPDVPAASFQAVAAYVVCHELDAGGVSGRDIRVSHGFSDGTQNRVNGYFLDDGSNLVGGTLDENGCIVMHNPVGAVDAETPDARASITAFGAGSVTVNWGIGDSVQRRVRIMLFGGDITNVSVGHTAISNGTFPFTVNVGFQPKIVMVAGDQYGSLVNRSPWGASGLGLYVRNAIFTLGVVDDSGTEANYSAREVNTGQGSSNATSVGAGFGTATGQQCGNPNQAFLLDIVATGYQLTSAPIASPNNNDFRLAHLCMDGDFSVQAGVVQSPTSPGTVAINTPGFTPVAGLVYGGISTCSPTIPQYGTDPAGSFGMFDGTNDSVYWHGSEGVVRASTHSTSGIVLHNLAQNTVPPFSLLESANLTRRVDGIDLVFGTADANAYNIAYLIFGNEPTLNVQLPVIQAAALPKIDVQTTFEETEVWPLHERDFRESVTGNAFDAIQAVRVDWTHSTHPAFSTWLYCDGRPPVGGEHLAISRVSFPKGATGVWTATTVDTGGNAPNLDGLTWTVNVSAQADALLSRGHLTVREAQGRKFFAWMNGEVFSPQLVVMGSPAWENSSLVPGVRDGPDFDGIPWPSFFDHDSDVVDTDRVDRWLDEFVGPGSAHGFNGWYIKNYHCWQDGGREGGGYGGGNSGGHFPSTDEDPSYQHYEALEHICKEIYKRGGCVCIRHMGDESDGNEQNLPGGYNGTEALRNQKQIIARILEIPGTFADWSYDCFEFNGAPSPPTGDFTLVRAVFEPYYTLAVVTRSHYRKIAQTAGEPNQIAMCRNYRGDAGAPGTSVLNPISDLTEVNCYEHQVPGWETSLAFLNPISSPLGIGFRDLLDNDNDESGASSDFHASFCADMWRIFGDGAGNWDFTESEVFEVLVKGFLGGLVGAAMADMTDEGPSAKPFLRASNEGQGPSNIFDSPEFLANINNFFQWDPLGSYGGQRYLLNVLPANSAWLQGFSSAGNNEVGPVGLYDPTNDRRYLLGWYNDGDPDTNVIGFDFSPTGAGMTQATGAVAVRIDSPTYTEVALTITPDQTPGAFTVIGPFPTTGKWLVHIDPVYPTLLEIDLPVVSAAALLAPSVAFGVLSVSLPAVAGGAALLAPTITLGAVSIDLPLLSADALPSPSVALGATQIDLPLESADPALPAPSVALGATGIDLPLISAPATIPELDVTFGNLDVDLPLVSAQATLKAIVISLGGAPAPILAALPLITGGTVQAPEVTFGNLDIDLPLVAAGGSPESPLVTLGATTIQLPVVSGGTLGAPEVTFGNLDVDLPLADAAPALPQIQVLLTQTVVGTCSASATASAECTTPGILLEGKPRVSQLDIWNIAAVSLGIGEFSSVTEDSLKRVRFDARWKSYKRKFFHDHPFKSAVTNAVLEEITNFPEARKGGWDKSFGFPCDYLRALRVNDDETFAASGRFEVLTDQTMSRKLLLTNETTVVLKYIFDPENYGLIDASVAEALGLGFGLQFAAKFGKSVSEIREMKETARMALRDAKAVDGMEGSPKQFFPSQLLDSMEGDFEGGF